MWADCYDYATRADYLGVGVGGNEKAAPYWTSEELDVAFSKVLGNGTEAVSIREKAVSIRGKISESGAREIYCCERDRKVDKVGRIEDPKVKGSG